MTPEEAAFWSGSWPFWSALAIAGFVFLYAASFGDADASVDLPSSSMDL